MHLTTQTPKTKFKGSVNDPTERVDKPWTNRAQQTHVAHGIAHNLSTLRSQMLCLKIYNKLLIILTLG